MLGVVVVVVVGTRSTDGRGRLFEGDCWIWIVLVLTGDEFSFCCLVAVLVVPSMMIRRDNGIGIGIWLKSSISRGDDGTTLLASIMIWSSSSSLSLLSAYPSAYPSAYRLSSSSRPPVLPRAEL